MPTAKKKVKKKRKPSFTLPKAAVSAYRVTSPCRDDVHVRTSHHGINGTVANGGTRSRYVGSTWNTVTSRYYQQQQQRQQQQHTYKHHMRMTTSLSHHRKVRTSGLDFNRLMHLNNRVVAKLNMLDIADQSQRLRHRTQFWQQVSWSGAE